MDLKAHPIFD